MKKVLTIFFLLSLFIVSSQAFALDNFYVATETPNGTNVIRVFSSSGATLGDIPISNTYKDAQFVSGNWINGQISILALKKNKKNSITASVINGNGNQIKEISLGKKVKKVIGLDYNNNGIQDLAVQLAKRVVVYLDPSISNTRANVKLTKFSDAVATQTYSGAGISSLKLEVMNKNFLDSIDAPQDLSAINNFITYKKQIRKRKFKNYKVSIKTTVQRVFPLKVENSNDPNFVIQSSARKLELIGRNFRNTSFSKNRNSKFFTGFFSSDNYSEIAIGQRLDTSTGIATVRLINPSTKEERIIKLNLNFQYSYSVNNYSMNNYSLSKTDCSEFNRLYNQLYKAYNSGNYNEYVRIYYLIIALPNFNECLDNIDSGGDDNGGDNDNDNENGDGKTEDDDNYFSSANSIAFITNVVQYSSNTGMARTPCNDIRNAKDGNNGFLARNSDFHPGVVYLTPGASYRNGRILNASTFRVMSKVPFDTVANGGRAHFRLSSIRLPFGPHIFAADNGYGETICWKVPGGMSRVD